MTNPNKPNATERLSQLIEETTSHPPRPGGLNRLILPAVLLGALLIGFSSTVKVIPAGEVGVVFSSVSGVKPTPLDAGIHFITPFIDHVTVYDSRLQAVTLAHTAKTDTDGEGAINARSKEGLDISADVTVQFQIDQKNAAKLHQELGANYLNTVIRPQIRSKVRDAIGQFNAAELISTQRQQVEQIVANNLKDIFAKNYITLDSVLLRELRIPDTITQAIQQKQNAEQQVAVQKNKLQQAQISAQQVVVEAQGKAQAAVETAKGEAQALSLRGKALRENPQLIQLTVAEKLSPTIQTVMLPSNGNFLLNMDSLKTGAAATVATQQSSPTDTTSDTSKP